MSWTSRERVMAVFDGEMPDRVPIFECVCHDGLLEHYGGGRIAVGDAEAVVRACSKFLDLSHPALAPQNPGCIKHPDGVTEIRYRWHSSRSPMPVGAEHMEQAIIEEVKINEAWRPAPKAVRSFQEEAGRFAAAAGEMVYINLASDIEILPFGPVNLEQGIYAYADRPGLVRQWNRAVNGKKQRYLDAVADGKTSPIAIIWCDIAAKNGLIYPPAMLEELFYPHLADFVCLLHSRGIKALFHSDGDVTAALPRLVECGIDGFNPLETSAGMKPETFRDICGKRVVLAGGIDAVEVLAHGTSQRVAQETRKLIDLFRPDGNLMVASASGQVDGSMPLENVRAMYETVWDYGKY
jgi:hypothetical protein